MVMKSLYTIGYEGESIGDFLATIGHIGIQTIIDVREVPISRKHGFSKTRFAEYLKTTGVSYLHLKGLGDPKPGRIAAREGRFEDFRSIFGAHMESPQAITDLGRAIQTARSTISCLMCFERDHHYCHRCIVAEKMATLSGFRLIHIGVKSGLSLNRKTTGAHLNDHEPLQLGHI